MALYDLKFIDCWFRNYNASVNHSEMDGKKFIEMCFYNENDLEHTLNLDISTAIKFAKTLRTEINKAKEVQNG